MRTYTTEHTVYHFDELSTEAQGHALDKLWDLNVDYDWWEYTLDYWKEKLSTYGFTGAKIYFSGFSGQGDGACFDSSVDMACLLNYAFYQATTYKEARLWRSAFIAWDRGKIEYLTIRIINSHYSHENTRTLETNGIYLEDCKTTDEIIELLEGLNELRRDLCQEIYADLEQEYDYLTSREAILESIEANEYEFTKDGNLA